MQLASTAQSIRRHRLSPAVTLKIASRRLWIHTCVALCGRVTLSLMKFLQSFASFNLHAGGTMQILKNQTRSYLAKDIYVC
jgi:hypothetical protein